VPIYDLLDVIFRWAHLIAGIMWVGNSMLFNWLDRNLEKKIRGQELSRLSQGKIFMVHSGAFYDVEKKLLEPGEMPDHMHWFKWQNGITWMTGIALLIVVYYMNDAAFLRDPAVANISPAVAIALSASALITAWIIYDAMWRLWGESNPKKATFVSIVLLFAMIVAFSKVFSGRGAYIMTGVVMGTLMTGNVWMCIVPSQRELIAATTSGRDQDPTLSLRAKQRSIHNNYMTFPLLFIMVSNHFGHATANHLNWVMLILVMVGGSGIRHFMNIRYRGEGKQLATWTWLSPALCMAAIAVVGLMAVSRIDPPPRMRVDYDVGWKRAQQIINTRCLQCHSKKPADSFYTSPPNNVMFDTTEQIDAMVSRIKVRAVDLQNMPLNNQTGMTDIERAELDAWMRAGAPLK
jgi:uncharacterized membrane protein